MHSNILRKSCSEMSRDGNDFSRRSAVFLCSLGDFDVFIDKNVTIGG